MADGGEHDSGSTAPDALHAWEEFVEEQVYPQPGEKAKQDYRNYESPTRDTVREFYRENHRLQTYDFVQRKRDDFLGLDRTEMSVFEALDFLNTLVDDSDPDIELDQLQHLLQTSEAIRTDGHGAGSSLPACCMIWVKCSASMANLNGQSLAIPFRWVAASATESSITNSSQRIPTHRTNATTLVWASTKRGVASPTSTYLGGTTNTYTTS